MRAEALALPSRPFPIGARGLVLLLILAGALLSSWVLRLQPRQLVPGQGGMTVAAHFFSRAVSPAETYERQPPVGTAPLLVKALEAARATVMFAAASMSLALVAGLFLGFFASTAWWAGERTGGDTTVSRWIDRSVMPTVYLTTRSLIAFLRSIHELLWAVLLLAAFGLGNLTAVIAMAIPYAGTLAKVFSEMIDEVPRGAATALRGSGASGSQVFLFALLPQALPDISAYSFYRFECALRSSAILGFFGFPTLGYYIAASFENLHYGEVWTYLYTLFGLIVITDWWSGALRRRFVA